MQITDYPVKYKLVGDFFWKTIKGVVGDDTVFRPNRGSTNDKGVPGEDTLPVRVLFRKDGTRFELPMNNTIIWFPPQRAEMIKQKIDEGKG